DGLHVTAMPVPSTLASATAGVLGRTAATVTVKLALVDNTPSVTVTVIRAVPARPFSGVMRRLHAPETEQPTASVDGETGSSAGFDEASEIVSALGITAPVMPNGTVTEPFCGTT